MLLNLRNSKWMNVSKNKIHHKFSLLKYFDYTIKPASIKSGFFFRVSLTWTNKIYSDIIRPSLRFTPSIFHSKYLVKNSINKDSASSECWLALCRPTTASVCVCRPWTTPWRSYGRCYRPSPTRPSSPRLRRCALLIITSMPLRYAICIHNIPLYVLLHIILVICIFYMTTKVFKVREQNVSRLNTIIMLACTLYRIPLADC